MRRIEKALEHISVFVKGRTAFLAYTDRGKSVSTKFNKFFLACNIAITVAGITLCLMSKNPLDLLPIAGVLLHTGAFWLTNEKIIRRVSLIGSPFWFVYNFVSRAYGSALGDLLTMCSIVIAMIKFRNRECEKDERV